MGDSRGPRSNVADLRRMRAFPHEYSDEDRWRVYRKTRRSRWVVIAFFVHAILVQRWWYWVLVLFIVGQHIYLEFLVSDVVSGIPHPGGTRQVGATERAEPEHLVSQELARLVEMHEAGHLTQAEFEAAKAKLLREE